MTQAQKSAIRVGVITTLLGGLSLLVFSKAAGQVVLRPEFDSHVQRSEMLDSLLLERTTDVLCEVKPSHRDCS